MTRTTFSASSPTSRRSLLLATGAAVLIPLGSGLVLQGCSSSKPEAKLLNVSYDVSREFYKDIDTAYVAAAARNGDKVSIQQSHGGSSKQVRSVAEGLQADVVTMNQASDIDFLADKGLVDKDWASKFPNNAAPNTSLSVILVRKGNPKQIHVWKDLAKPGVEAIIPNP